MKTALQILVLFSAMMTATFGFIAGTFLGKSEESAGAAFAVCGTFSLGFLVLAVILTLVLIFKKDKHGEHDDEHDEDEHDEDEHAEEGH